MFCFSAQVQVLSAALKAAQLESYTDDVDQDVSVSESPHPDDPSSTDKQEEIDAHLLNCLLVEESGPDCVVRGRLYYLY